MTSERSVPPNTLDEMLPGVQGLGSTGPAGQAGLGIEGSGHQAAPGEPGCRSAVYGNHTATGAQEAQVRQAGGGACPHTLPSLVNIQRKCAPGPTLLPQPPYSPSSPVFARPPPTRAGRAAQHLQHEEQELVRVVLLVRPQVAARQHPPSVQELRGAVGGARSRVGLVEHLVLWPEGDEG